MVVGLDFFFGLGQQREDFGHGEDFDGWEKLAGEMRKSAGVESAGGDFGEEVGAEHSAPIGEIDGAGDMARVAMFALHGGELRGEFGRENESEVFRGLVAHGLGDEVGECHMAAARSVMSVDTRVSRAARSTASPME
jgi:hypothetical protein